MKYHFIGVCGKAMGTLAAMLQSQGHTVTGSDEGFYEPMLSYLKQHSIHFVTGYHASNIPDDVDYIVIGKHAKLVPEENEEVAHAFATPQKVLSLPQVMAQLTEGKDTIICAGSFGKSTVTTLTSFVLEHAGVSPSYFIGAVPIDLADSGVLRDSPIFVLEGDEYPSSNFDDRAKFLHYNPRNIILTSCEHDHINVYPTLASYIEPFKQLMTVTPAGGVLVYAKHGAHIESDILPVATHLACISYGISDADYTASNIVYGETTTFDLVKNGQTVISLSTQLLGQHNIENIVGVSAMLLEKGLVSIDQLRDAVAVFHGVKGRLDRKVSDSQIPILESFGSSYAKAKADIQAIKLHFPNKQIIAVFEPHTFGWRNRGNLAWYDDVFAGVNVAYIFQPPMHGAGTHDQLSLDEIVARVAASGIRAVAVHRKEDVYALLKTDLNDDSLVVLITSGALDGLPEELPKHIGAL